MKLSLIVPCYNEGMNVIPFRDAVISAFQNCGFDYEIIFIEDGSKDSTLHNLRKIHAEARCPTKVISFSRNFGKEAGLYAGMEHASGDYISLIDADLQQKPEIVLDMVKYLEENSAVDVVAAFQDRRREGAFLSFFKKGFYCVINKLSSVELRADASDFRTFRRSVAESMLKLKEAHRFSKGIFSWVGFETHFIPYVPAERAGGKTKWSFRKLFNYAIDGIIGFSTAPLRLATYLGLFTALVAAAYMVVVIFQKLIWGIAVPGYATIITLILLLGGIQLLCIGIIGEYVGKIFEQSKDRPIYIAKEILSSDDSNSR